MLCCVQVNLSCNFFKGSFDVPRYVGFVDDYWLFLQALEARQGLRGYGESRSSSSSSSSSNGGAAAAETGSGAGSDSKED